MVVAEAGTVLEYFEKSEVGIDPGLVVVGAEISEVGVINSFGTARLISLAIYLLNQTYICQC